MTPMMDPAGFGVYRTVWEANMPSLRAYWSTLAPPAPLANISQTLMYDAVEVWDAIRRYTGDAAAYDPCVAAAIYQWRDLYALRTGGSVRDFNNLTTGLRDHHVRTGDRASREAVVLQSVNCVFASDGYPIDQTVNQSASRPCALAIMSYLDAEDCGAGRRARLDHYARLALGHCDQWLAPEADWPAGRFLQPFMVGLTLRSLIAYWDRYREGGVDTTVTPNVPVTGIPAKVKATLDLLWSGSHGGVPFWYPDQHAPGHGYANGSGYPSGPAGTGAFGYIYTPIATEGDSSPSAVLNQFVAPAFYWYYLYSGDVAYRDRGDAVFAGAMSSSPGVFGSNAKAFNQNYFWSTQGVGWRDRALAPPAAATALALTGPAVLSGPANAPSGPFVVSLVPSGSATANPVVATPVVPGGGRSLPGRLVLTADRPTQSFRAIPAAGSAGTSVAVGVANDGGLITPAPIAYAVAGTTPPAVGYTLTGPAAANDVNQASPPILVALDPPGSAPGPAADATAGLVVVYLSDNRKGGGWSHGGPPTGYSWPSAEAPTQAESYFPVSAGPMTISSFNAVGLPDPPSITYTPGPSTGPPPVVPPSVPPTWLPMPATRYARRPRRWG